MPSLNIELTSKPRMRTRNSRSNRSNYWEGAVTYDGTQRGVGYLEMTGYDGAVHF